MLPTLDRFLVDPFALDIPSGLALRTGIGGENCLQATKPSSSKFSRFEGALARVGTASAL